MNKLICVVAVAGLSSAALAGVAGITIIGDVTNTTVAGNFGGPTPVYSDATRYHYYTFTAAAGSTVNYSAARTTGALDPAIFIFQGNMGGTPFDGSNPYTSSPWLGFTQLDFADDDVAPALPGPYGDPVGSFIAPATGTYTLVILSSVSSAAGPDGLGYMLTVTPTPGAAAALGLGALAGLRRRR